MSKVSMRDMLEAGVHFGHQARRWNPRMKQFIWGERNGVHILDLKQTAQLFSDAMNFVGRIGQKGGKVLFVGTKRQAQEVIVQEAERSKQPFVNHRWLGGMLTNFATIKMSIERLGKVEGSNQDNDLCWAVLPYLSCGNTCLQTTMAEKSLIAKQNLLPHADKYQRSTYIVWGQKMLTPKYVLHSWF